MGVVVNLEVRQHNTAVLVSGREAMFTFRTLVLKTERPQISNF
jgi:hypothetical protein